MTGKIKTPRIELSRREQFDSAIDQLVKQLLAQVKNGDISFTGSNAMTFIKAVTEYEEARDNKIVEESLAQKDERYSNLSYDELEEINKHQQAIEDILNRRMD